MSEDDWQFDYWSELHFPFTKCITKCNFDQVTIIVGYRFSSCHTPSVSLLGVYTTHVNIVVSSEQHVHLRIGRVVSGNEQYGCKYVYLTMQTLTLSPCPITGSWRLYRQNWPWCCYTSVRYNMNCTTNKIIQFHYHGRSNWSAKGQIGL